MKQVDVAGEDGRTTAVVRGSDHGDLREVGPGDLEAGAHGVWQSSSVTMMATGEGSRAGIPNSVSGFPVVTAAAIQTHSRDFPRPSSPTSRLMAATGRRALASQRSGADGFEVGRAPQPGLSVSPGDHWPLTVPRSIGTNSSRVLPGRDVVTGVLADRGLGRGVISVAIPRNSSATSPACLQAGFVLVGDDEQSLPRNGVQSARCALPAPIAEHTATAAGRLDREHVLLALGDEDDRRVADTVGVEQAAVGLGVARLRERFVWPCGAPGGRRDSCRWLGCRRGGWVVQVAQRQAGCGQHVAGVASGVAVHQGCGGLSVRVIGQRRVAVVVGRALRHGLALPLVMTVLPWSRSASRRRSKAVAVGGGAFGCVGPYA